MRDLSIENQYIERIQKLLFEALEGFKSLKSMIETGKNYKQSEKFAIDFKVNGNLSNFLNIKIENENFDFKSYVFEFFSRGEGVKTFEKYYNGTFWWSPNFNGISLINIQQNWHKIKSIFLKNLSIHISFISDLINDISDLSQRNALESINKILNGLNLKDKKEIEIKLFKQLSLEISSNNSK